MWFLRKAHAPIRTLIGEGTTFTGEVRFSDGLRIDGEVIGDVVAQPGSRTLVVISENARVCGRVKASHVIINGAVEGPVVCDDLLELQPHARVTGDVRYETLEMHPGATIDGELKPLQHDATPPLKLAASNDA